MSLFPEVETKDHVVNTNRLSVEDRSIHNWYRFVLSFPPHLVREYFKKFDLKNGETVLDPFCGTGTTILEAKLNGFAGIGIEANPIAYFATMVKTNFDVDAEVLLADSIRIAHKANDIIQKKPDIKDVLYSLTQDEHDLLLANSISPLPLTKTLVLLRIIREYQSTFLNNQLLALASSTVKYASNLHFGPEVGVKRLKKSDADVVHYWLETLKEMSNDLKMIKNKSYYPTKLFLGDSRDLTKYLDYNTIDTVFTSPPYPNEKDYTRTTRLESVILGFIKSKADLKNLKKNLLRSNSRNVYKNDDDDKYIQKFPEIENIAREIEDRRKALNKTSGFERLYHKVTKLYFGGMAMHLESLKPYLKKNAILGYVVGDQASYLQVYIPTGKILANIADKLGYEIIGIDLFRKRFATATRKEMNEEVVVLKWGGKDAR